MQHEVLLTGRSDHLHGNLWKTEHGSPKGVIIGVHGLGDHGERFASIAAALCGAGWHLLAFDQQGHGKSPGQRGDIDSYDGLLADIAAARSTAQHQLGDVPQFLLGQSMGGNLALNYALRVAEFDSIEQPPSGLLLISPMILPPDPPQRPHVFAAWLTGRVFGWLRTEQEG